jgi:hypothetical protein
MISFRLLKKDGLKHVVLSSSSVCGRRHQVSSTAAYGMHMATWLSLVQPPYHSLYSTGGHTLILYTNALSRVVLLATPLAQAEESGVRAYNDSFHFPQNLGEQYCAYNTCGP